MRKRYFIGGGILLASVIYPLYLSFGNSVSCYITVSEFYGGETELQDIDVLVADFSISRSAGFLNRRKSPADCTLHHRYTGHYRGVLYISGYVRGKYICPTFPSHNG